MQDIQNPEILKLHTVMHFLDIEKAIIDRPDGNIVYQRIDGLTCDINIFGNQTKLRYVFKPEDIMSIGKYIGLEIIGFTQDSAQIHMEARNADNKD